MREEKLEELKRYVNELKWFKKEIIKTNSSFIKVIPQDFYLNNGAVIRREQVMKNGKDGSAVIIVPKVGNEYLMTIEPRVFTEKRIAVSFPAGYIEKDETPKKAAARELKEETGYVAKSIKVLDSYYQDEGVSAAYNYLLLAKDCVKQFEQHLDKDEFVKYMTFTYDELLELEKYGYISGGNAKLALSRMKEVYKN